MSKREVRSFKSADVEVRKANGDKIISGWAIVYNSPADIGSFVEYVRPGAADKSIRKGQVLALWNHNMDSPIGNQAVGTLVLDQQPKGIRYSITLPKSPLGDMVYEAARRQDATGTSFGFVLDGSSPEPETWQYDAQGDLCRYLNSIELIEVSPCTIPAYSASTLTAEDIRSIRAKLDSKRNLLDDDDNSDCDCDPDIDPDCDCDEDSDEDRDTAYSDVETCSQCGQLIRSTEDIEALRLLLSRLG